MPDDAIQPSTARASEGSDFAQRGDEILSLARTAFVEKGFDGASMQDLARAAGMSAGNFYRYFPSKAAIVEALVARDLAEVEEAFRSIVASPDPLSALKSALRFEMGRHCEGRDDLLWAEIAAAATRKPEVAATLARMEEGITHRVAQVMGLAAGLPEAEALERFGIHSRLIFLIMHGAMTAQMARTQPRDGELIELVLSTIDRVMDDAIADLKDR
jgi:AcrR family transcriptional regulator